MRLQTCVWWGAALVLACDPAARFPAVGKDDETRSDDGGAPSGSDEPSVGTTMAPSGSQDAGGDSTMKTGLDGGTLGPVIGTIDPDAVTLVEAEAAAPLVPLCSVNSTREASVAATLPPDAVALSITPDGEFWAYARPKPQAVFTAVDASAGDEAGVPDASTGAGDGALDAGVAFEVVVEGEAGQTLLALPPDQAVALGVGLSPNALQLVTTRADQRGFVLWERTDPEAAFAQAEVQPFVRLNALGAQGGVRFESPVFSASGVRLYVRETHPGTGPLQLVLRDGQWETEQRITNDPLLPATFNVTAASADDLTIFGWSASEQRSVAWWRPRADEPFDSSTAIGDVAILAVSEDCESWWALQ